MKKPETKLEEQSCRLVQDYGGRAEKLVLETDRGFPDRTLFFPNQVIGFIELKQPGGRLSPHQRKWLQILQAFGHPVGAYESLWDVERFIRRITK